MKEIKKQKVHFIEMWDKSSRKGFPTKESVLLTIAIHIAESDTDISTIGVAVKVPGDQPIPRVGKAIAVRGLNSSLLDCDETQPENSVLHYLWYKGMKFNSKIMQRIEYIISKPTIGIQKSEGNYPYGKPFANYIED